MVSRGPRSVSSNLDELHPPGVPHTLVPFPKFTDLSSDSKRGFVQFWPERDAGECFRFLRALDPIAHARWWVREVVSRTGSLSEYPADCIVRDNLERSISIPSYRQRVLGALDVIPGLEHLREAARMYGYREDSAIGRYVLNSPRINEYATPMSLSEKIGEGWEVLKKIPEQYDPAIFFEHTATHSPFASPERRRAEGEQDAECVRRYLTAYQRFMTSPSVGELFSATIHPRFGDSYYLAMKYCLNNDVSDNFISLLHVSFAWQWVIETRPRGGVSAPQDSRGLFREDVELFSVAVRRYCTP